MPTQHPKGGRAIQFSSQCHIPPQLNEALPISRGEKLQLKDDRMSQGHMAGLCQGLESRSVWHPCSYLPTEGAACGRQVTAVIFLAVPSLTRLVHFLFSSTPDLGETSAMPHMPIASLEWKREDPTHSWPALASCSFPGLRRTWGHAFLEGYQVNKTLGVFCSALMQGHAYKVASDPAFQRPPAPRVPSTVYATVTLISIYSRTHTLPKDYVPLQRCHEERLSKSKDILGCSGQVSSSLGRACRAGLEGSGGKHTRPDSVRACACVCVLCPTSF